MTRKRPSVDKTHLETSQCFSASMNLAKTVIYPAGKIGSKSLCIKEVVKLIGWKPE